MRYSAFLIRISDRRCAYYDTKNKTMLYENKKNGLIEKYCKMDVFWYSNLTICGCVGIKKHKKTVKAFCFDRSVGAVKTGFI